MDTGAIDELSRLEEIADGDISDVAPWQMIMSGLDPEGSVYLLGRTGYVRMEIDTLRLVPVGQASYFETSFSGFVNGLKDDPDTIGFIPADDSVSLSLGMMGLDYLRPLLTAYRTNPDGSRQKEGMNILIYSAREPSGPPLLSPYGTIH